MADTNPMAVPAAIGEKKKRLCRFPGCTKVIKSQGHCQKHGARAKRCKVPGCEKQAQGTHDGMCKRHWKAIHMPEQAGAEASESSKHNPQQPPPEGDSVYDSILPRSISYRPHMIQPPHMTVTTMNGSEQQPTMAQQEWAVMPLIKILKEGMNSKPAGWHRQEERRARGMFPVPSLQTQLEPWERQLALVEVLLISGGVPSANFKDLSHAWGREKGFHTVLVNAICERRGEVDRKRRTDAGSLKSSTTSGAPKKARQHLDPIQAALDPPLAPLPGTEEPVVEGAAGATGDGAVATV